MGKKTNSNSEKTDATEKVKAGAGKTKQPSRKGLEGKKATLTEKAVKAVAAVAVSVGGAIAAKRRSSTSRKASTKKVSEPALSELRSPSPSYTREEIALRAYFLAEERSRTGLPSNPSENWLEAERQLLKESESSTT